MFGLLRRMPGYRLLLLVLVPVGLAAGAMFALRPRHAVYAVDPAERYVVDRATRAAAEALARGLPQRKVLLLPLADDRDGFVTAELRDQLVDVGGFEIAEPRDLGTMNSVVLAVEDFVRRLMGSANVAEVNAEPVAAAARQANAPVGVFGKVTARGTAGGRSTADLVITAVRADDGRTVFTKAFDERLDHSWTNGAYVRVWISSRAWWARMLVWIAVVGLVPLATAAVAKPILARESNAANAALMIVYILVDAAAAWFLLGLTGGAAAVILVVLAAVAGATYNFVVCDRLAAKRTGA